ncbi:MAG: Maf family protein [Rhodospirillales bacterium]|nr:Maf family protein [Rhodospirillales bacterium]
MSAPPQRIILASGSTARQHLLRQAGVDFTVEIASVDEDAAKQAGRAEGSQAGEVALLLAGMKARRVSARHPDAWVVGADQMLVCGDRWFDKPPDLAAARAQLLALRGQTHHLPTALVCFRAGTRVWHHLAEPKLTMRHFSDAFLDRYIAEEGEAVLGSVGAYRIEALGMQLFAAIEGSTDAICGLPLLPLLGYLRDAGAIAA